MISAYARGTQALIDLDAVRRNVEFFQSMLSPNTALMAVVKADAYGHGVVPVARAVLAAGAQWLGVAAAEEGEELRAAGVSAPILILGASSAEQVRIALQSQLDLTLFDRDTWDAVQHWGSVLKVRPRVHLKVDTGMGRVGVQPQEVAVEWLDRLAESNVTWQGLMSHLATSDSDEQYTQEQLSRFLDVIEQIRQRQVALPPTIHLANSAAALRFPGTHFNLVRVGIGLYGGRPYAGSPRLWPVMQWVSRVTLVKQVPAGTSIGYGRTYVAPADCTVATLAVGYADGYRRAFSNRAAVLIKGARCPVVGRVSMDQITVVVPQGMSVSVGDQAVLLGEDGTEHILVEDLAVWADTISYEILTGISARVPRLHLAKSTEMDRI